MTPVARSAGLPTGDPLRTLAAGLQREEAATDGAAQALAADPFSIDAHVELMVAGRGFQAIARAFSSVDETERSVIDLLA